MRPPADALLSAGSIFLLKGFTMFKKIAFAATMAILAATSVAAEIPSFYAGADIGSTKFDFIPGHQGGFGGFVGYTINMHVAVEANYRRLAQMDGVYVNGVKSDLSINQAAVSVIGMLPLTKDLNVFARYGRIHLDSKASGANVSLYPSGNGALFGAGLGYAITPTVSVRMEYQVPTGDSRNISASVAYNF